MKSKKLSISIKKPVSEVFDFTLNPNNTPYWIAGIVQEQANEFPPKQGTIYKNKNKHQEWSEYTMTAFEIDKMFIWTKSDNNYHVKYTFTLTDQNTTKLEYFEWVDKGELDEPFSLAVLKKLKSVVEAL